MELFISLVVYLAIFAVIFLIAFIVMRFVLGSYFTARQLAIASVPVTFVTVSILFSVMLMRSSPSLIDQDKARYASRLFAGPNQYPPYDFAAYGILAFRSRATSFDRDRYLMLCEAYLAVFPHVTELLLPRSQQMVTVWPIVNDSSASVLNLAPREEVCETAVAKYGLVAALEALADASRAGADVDDRGPYLLAWSPSINKGKSDVLVLVTDLSNVTTFDQALSRLLRWRSDILSDPKIWSNGWNIERVRVKIREWADRFGPKIMLLFGGQK